MNQHQAPIGTVATIGHPANKTLIAKGSEGWRYLHNGKPVNDEDFRGGWDDYIPETPTNVVIDVTFKMTLDAGYSPEKFVNEFKDYLSGSLTTKRGLTAINSIEVGPWDIDE